VFKNVFGLKRQEVKENGETCNVAGFIYIYIYIYIVSPTRYRTRHFFNNFTTNENIATKFEADYRHITFHFSHKERTPAISSLVLELLKRCRVRQRVGHTVYKMQHLEVSGAVRPRSLDVKG